MHIGNFMLSLINHTVCTSTHTCIDPDILGPRASPLHLQHLQVSALDALPDHFSGGKVVSGGDLVDVAGDLVVAVVVLPVTDCVSRGRAASLPLGQLDLPWKETLLVNLEI